MESVARFMQGRYGVDAFSRFQSYASVAFLLFSLLFKRVADGKISTLFFYIAFALLIWSYVRMLSRDFLKRQKENDKYLELSSGARSFFLLQRDRIRQRKSYAFFRCPGCREILRVPRGKGRIRISCRRCGYSFEKKT